MKLEELERVLTHPNITNVPVTEKPGSLNRDRSFSIFGHDYTIEWWCNMLYLKHGGVLVAADEAKQSGTWPNHSRLNLQFYRHGEVVGIIELEPFELTEA